MKKLILAVLLLASAAGCATASAGRTDWTCDGGAAFSARVRSNGRAEVFAGGQVYTLPQITSASGARYSDGAVEYWEHGGEATLTGARAGPYANCRRT